MVLAQCRPSAGATGPRRCCLPACRRRAFRARCGGGCGGGLRPGWPGAEIGEGADHAHGLVAAEVLEQLSERLVGLVVGVAAERHRQRADLLDQVRMPRTSCSRITSPRMRPSRRMSSIRGRRGRRCPGRKIVGLGVPRRHGGGCRWRPNSMLASQVPNCLQNSRATTLETAPCLSLTIANPRKPSCPVAGRACQSPAEDQGHACTAGHDHPGRPDPGPLIVQGGRQGPVRQGTRIALEEGEPTWHALAQGRADGLA